jgi:uncharacterized protein (UPF0332 family)
MKQLIRYRMDRADETFKDAKTLALTKSWKSCINRLYYSCFYAASALLAQHNLSSSKHSGVLSLFNLHFIKSGKLSKDIAEVYNDLFDSRQEGDYTDFAVFTEDFVTPMIVKTGEFIQAVKMLVDIE